MGIELGYDLAAQPSVSNLDEMGHDNVRCAAGTDDLFKGFRKLDIVARNRTIIAAASLKRSLHEIIGQAAIDLVPEESDRRLRVCRLIRGKHTRRIVLRAVVKHQNFVRTA